MQFCEATSLNPADPLMKACYAEPFVSGIRCAIVFHGTEGGLCLKDNSLFSSALAIIEHGHRVIKELSYSLIIDDVVIDGVLTRSLFHAFDVLPRESWENKETTVPLHCRKSVLASIMMIGEFKKTLFVPTTHVYSLDEVKAAYNKQRSKGYQGIVLKVIDSEYTFGATEDWKFVRNTVAT